MKENTLKEFGKVYFKQLLEEEHPSIKYGDVLNIGIQYLDDKGIPVSECRHLETIHKDDLKQ